MWLAVKAIITEMIMNSKLEVKEEEKKKSYILTRVILVLHSIFPPSCKK